MSGAPRPQPHRRGLEEQFRQAQRRAGSVPAQEQPATPHFTPLRKADTLARAVGHDGVIGHRGPESAPTSAGVSAASFSANSMEAGVAVLKKVL